MVCGKPSMKNLVIVEGETEEKFFKDFKDKLKIPSMIVKHNLAQEDLNSKITGKKYHVISVVLDSDVFNEKTISKINKNLKSINADTINIYIQNKNFEDELVRATENCNTIKDLCNLFGCRSKSLSEFKSRFLKVSNLSLKKDFKVDFYKLYSNTDIGDIKFKKGRVRMGKTIFTKKKQ